MKDSKDTNALNRGYRSVIVPLDPDFDASAQLKNHVYQLVQGA